MQHSNSSTAAIFQEILSFNTNPPGYKDVLSSITKDIEERTYWYYTADQTEFLEKMYDKELNQQVLKKRIIQITDEKMTELMLEIFDGTVKKVHQEQQTDQLDVQLGVEDFYDQVPQEDQRAKKGKERIQQINEDFYKFKEKMEEKKRAIEVKKAEKEALEAEVKKSLENERRQEHRKELKQHIDLLKKTDQQRKEENQKFKLFFKQYKKAKPLHILMEQSYKQRVVLPALEQNKKKLESLGHRKKPTLEQINQHERAYLQIRENRPEKQLVLNTPIDVSYKSHFYQEEEELLKERKEFQQTGPSWDHLEKQKRYSQFVKDKLKPKLSRKLKESLKQSVERNHHHSLEVPDRTKVIDVGMSYLQYMRGLDKRRRTATPSHPPQVEAVGQSRYLNYLQELKSKSEHHASSMNWEKDMKDMTTSRLQKRQRVLMKSKQLEERARMDEKLVSHYNFGKADEIIAKKKEIDETLLSSIKAKVAILKEAQQP